MWCRVCGVFVLFMLSFSIAADQLVLTIASNSGQEKGSVTIELNTEFAPNHVARIKQLAEEGLYNGVAFHRVINGFMAQTGDVEFGNTQKYNDSKAGQGGSSYSDLKAEFSNISFKLGVVGMARSGYIHSANSQFFIMTQSNPGLDGQYTVIGRVSDGLDVVRNIKKGSSAQNGKVSAPDMIKAAVIVASSAN